MSECKTNTNLLITGGLLIGSGLLAITTVYLTQKRQPTILQHPSQPPGRWEQTVVIVYDNVLKGYRIAMFNGGLDYPNDKIVSRSDVYKKIDDLKKQGWVERDVKIWGEHYGISV